MRSPTLLSPVLLALALYGCGKDDDTNDTTDTDVFVPDTDIEADLDKDGYTESAGDCDDGNPSVYPGASEACNGADDNCNGMTDEGLADADADGTCNDLDSEDCDGSDNDGDGLVDEDFGDADDDGVADCADGEDCDGVDNTGEGDVDEGYDADSDGFSQCGGDCDDADANRNPGKTEVDGDTQDNDCDGFVDENGWAAGDLIITEIMTNPTSVADPKGEWFEVYNASGGSITINGLMITDSTTDSHQVTSDDALTIPAGGYFVLGGESDALVNGGAPVDYEYSGLTLGNGSDDLSLWVQKDDGTKVVIDSVAWDGGVSFPDPDQGSMALEPSFMGTGYNDDGTYWCESPNPWGTQTDNGTPGAENEWCTSFDHDSDGYSQDDGDCNDGDDTIYPGAPEIDGSIDNDCDGVAELGPTADARLGAASETEECGSIVLDGSASTDPDGNVPLTYQWELTSAPAGSARTSADISSSTSATASFEPDADGAYVFSLTVWDSGGAASTPDSLSVTVSARSTNSTPASNAGANQSASGTADCAPLSYGTAGYDCEACVDYYFTLDGSGSTDADGDSLTYSWSVTSGSASLSDSTVVNPTLTVTSPSVSYGITNSNTVNVQLKVTDCMGASDTDNLAVSYSCTGG
jgi:hypothetical protein